MKKKSTYCIIIDTTGMRCPLPVLKVRKNLPLLKKNELALIIADDPLAEVDLRHFCDSKNYKLENVSIDGDADLRYYEIKY